MTEFEHSPRSSKRIKTATYKANSAVLASAIKSAKNVSKRRSIVLDTFNPSGREREAHDEEQDHDSAYGSKEDSLVEEQVGPTQNVPEEKAKVSQAKARSGSTTGHRNASAGKTVSSEQADERTNGNKTTSKQGRTWPVHTKKAETISPRKNVRVSSGLTRNLVRTNANELAEAENPPESPTTRTPRPRRQPVRQQGSDPRSASPLSPKAGPEDDSIVASSSRTHVSVHNSGTANTRHLKEIAVDDGLPPGPRPASGMRVDHVVDAARSPIPKGILTPSRRKRNGPRKSVIFHDTDSEVVERLGFKDIDMSSTKKSKQIPPSTVASLVPSSHSTAEDQSSSFEQQPPKDILSLLSLPQDCGYPAPTKPDSPSLLAIKSHIFSRFVKPQPAIIPNHLVPAYTTLSNLLTSTITTSESNSLLLLGSRGSGKTLLVNKALSSLKSQYPNDFHIVHLNGFYHTDDRLALREIWRQLGREMAVDETETGEVMGSYADTMASLLSLLSHPDEIDAEAMEIGVGTGPTETRASKSVIIILDEFDLFTMHTRQTLLYNLFDIAQSRKAPVAVIGCSTRMDVVECLEKRVKSRFSHRWVHVPQVNSLQGFTENVERVLCIDDEEVVQDVVEGERIEWNEFVRSKFIKDDNVKRLLKEVFYTTKSTAEVLKALHIPLATACIDEGASTPNTAGSEKGVKHKARRKNLDTSTPARDVDHIAFSTVTISSTAAPSLLTLLPTLPLLHVSLLICSTRLEAIYLTPSINFNVVHHHYTQLHNHTRLKLSSVASGTASSLRLWGKETCRAAWEDLVRWELLVPVKEGKEEIGDELARWYRVEITLEEMAWAVKEGLGKEGGGVAEVLGRWCREEMVGW